MALLEDARNSRITFGDSRDGLEGALGSSAVPIFEYERLDASVIKAAGVSDLAINNNHLCIALGASTCEMARIALSDPGAELKRTKVSMSINDRFRRIFQDAEGLHLLVVMESDEVYYLQQGSSKPRFIKSLKMSGQKITAVAWDRGSRSKSEKTALIGTSGGFILEMTIDANPQNESKPRVLTVINDEPKQIIGLDVQTTSKSYTVIAATALKLFMYNGTGNLRQQEFEVVKNCKVLSVPLMDPEGCFSIFRGNWNQEPSFFGWAYKQNISVGSIVFETEMETGSFVGTPSLTRIEDSTKDTAPLSIAFTTFHILVLYRDRIVAINKRSFKEVHEVTLSEMEVVGEPGRLIRDESTGKIWLFTHKSIFALVMKNESRNEWLYCLEKNQFSEALSFCTDDSQREAVNMAQGEYLLSKKMYKEASQSLAATKKPVEELALKLISPDKSDDLKSYLRAKLRYIPETEIIQKILLYTWLLELYLTQLRKTPKIDLEIEFDQFLAEVIPESWFKTHIIKMTHNMILDHGRLRQLVSFSERVQNFDFVIHFYINEQKYNSALKVLIDQDIPELYYKFSPLLIKSIPYQLISAWKNTSKRLNLKKLIPAFTDRSFLSTNPKAISMIIEYIQEQLRNGDQEGLDGMIDEMVSSLTDNLDIFNFDVEDDTAIHNLIVALLLEFCDEQSTIKYLQSENAKYDKFFTLYLCNKLGKKKLSVVVYGEMKLYEDAVSLALAEGAPQLARVYASKAEGQQRKKLWLIIAKSFFTKDYWDKTASAQQSMDIAEHLKTGDLQIEDILSFFESETIDGVDEHIRTAFKGYQSKIEKLIQDMDEATFSSDQIRHEIEATPNKFGFVDDQRKCDQCSKLLFTQPFYLFPCLHAFHCRCLEDQHRQFRFENNVLDECIFCGTAMIDSVSVSILKDNERDPSWFI